MTSTNKKREIILGMTFGKAANRLRKSILFEYVKKAGEDICYVCKQNIENINDFTIEHKVSWLNSENPKELFWDIHNISFSHAKCNRPTTRHINSSQKIKPEDNKNSICSDCKKEKPKEQFHSRKTRWNGVDFRCRDCAKLSVYKYRKLNKSRGAQGAAEPH